MDWLELKQSIKIIMSKYKFPALILCTGILLMTMPRKEETVTAPVITAETAQGSDITDRLTEILEHTDGVGKVRVMLTESSGSETIYQTDEEQSHSGDSSNTRVSTVLVSSGGSDLGLIRTVMPPVYLGAVVVCQGGDDPAVRLAITQAVSALTGIGADRITVLKMK